MDTSLSLVADVIEGLITRGRVVTGVTMSWLHAISASDIPSTDTGIVREDVTVDLSDGEMDVRLDGDLVEDAEAVLLDEPTIDGKTIEGKVKEDNDDALIQWNIMRNLFANDHFMSRNEGDEFTVDLVGEMIDHGLEEGDTFDSALHAVVMEEGMGVMLPAKE